MRERDLCESITTASVCTLLALLSACGDAGPVVGSYATPLTLPTSVVQVVGNQLVVRKRLSDQSLDVPRPYFIRGVVWQAASRAPEFGPNPENPTESVPYGFFFDGPWREPGPQGHEIFTFWLRNYHALNPEQYQTDIPLIRGLNANTVRTFDDLGDDVAVAKAVLDALYENGLMVVLTVASSKADLDAGRHLAAVQNYKNHPAVLMWLLGNEWNINRYYGGFASVAQAAAATQQAALAIKALDSDHPVSSSLGDIDTVSAATQVPAVDIWGLNIYRGSSFGSLFGDWASTGKPFYLSEFGTDSFQTTNFVQDGGRAAQVSGVENETMQADAVIAMWGELEQHRATATNAELCNGGLVFEFNDELWPVGNFHAYLGDLVDYNSPDGAIAYRLYNGEGFVVWAQPDGVSNEEYFGIVDADRNPKQLYARLAQAFGYTLHLGLDEAGSDVFPRETAAETHLTAAAAVRMSLLYLEPSYSPTQQQIYATYHTGPAGQEMSGMDAARALNAGAGSVYNFEAAADTDQMEAIRRIVHWMDYLPPGGKNVPSMVPTGGGLDWKVVRGFAVDSKPFDPSNVFDIRDVELRGVWLNDPGISGLGFDVFQTAAFFQGDYRPIDGIYWNVNEPPRGSVQFAPWLRRARLRLARRRPGREMRRLLEDSHDSRDLSPRRVALARLREALPAALLADATFLALFDESRALRRFRVEDLDTNTRYALFALGPKRRGAPFRAHAVVQVDPPSRTIDQVTWDTNGATAYPIISPALARLLARRAAIHRWAGAATPAAIRRRLGVASRWSRATLVWSRRFGTSRFHPSYRFRFASSSVIVHPDGRVEAD